MQQCEKNKILSRLRCLVQEMKSQTEQISEFYRFISESQIPESEALSFIKQHEDQNMMEPFYSFITRQEIKKVFPYDIAQEFLQKEFKDKSSNLIYLNSSFQFYHQNHYKMLSNDELNSKTLNFINKAWFLKNCRTSALLNDVVTQLKAISYINARTSKPFWLNSPETDGSHYIPLKNHILDIQGYLDGQESALKKHSIEFICPYCLPYEYQPSATSIIWEEVLKSIFENESEKIDFLQEWFGYSLIPETSQEKALLMFGEGSNGKSVILNVLMKLVGPENTSTIGLEAFSAQKTFQLATTINKLINVCTDLNEVKRAAEGLLKKFISGEPITIEEKYKPAQKYKPYARLTFSANILPRFSDRSNGIERRIILLSFNKQFLDESKQNKDFAKAEWWQNNNELEGIFQWALKGLSRLIKRGYFRLPPSMQNDKKKYFEESNPTLTFIKSYFQYSEGNQVAAITAYKNYQMWMKSNGYKTPLTQLNFSRELGKAFPNIYQGNSMKVINLPDEKLRSKMWHNLELLCDEVT